MALRIERNWRIPGKDWHLCLAVGQDFVKVVVFFDTNGIPHSHSITSF